MYIVFLEGGILYYEKVKGIPLGDLFLLFRLAWSYRPIPEAPRSYGTRASPSGIPGWRPTASVEAAADLWERVCL